ncbi:hypothetical protein ACSX1A_08115 [Pontibacter sp. MBLB2868]|uniref:hypothetical protein n=1 Tax=Pontibacter sp. MBLB2868 TaxID=3451555 RepID=UPI003F75457A
MQLEVPRHMGIDYGSRLAGTTAVAMVQNGLLEVWQSTRGQDADKWLLNLTKALKPNTVFIDAPLSLPKVYAADDAFTSGSEYFYRVCDKEVQAMSPMFLGGLTARAIRFRVTLAEQGLPALETYPSQLAKLLFEHLPGYKKDPEALPVFTEALQSLLPVSIAASPSNWHQFDSLLAWFSGFRHLQGQSILYGDAREGRIIV